MFACCSDMQIVYCMRTAFNSACDEIISKRQTCYYKISNNINRRLYELGHLIFFINNNLDMAHDFIVYSVSISARMVLEWLKYKKLRPRARLKIEKEDDTGQTFEHCVTKECLLRLTKL